MALTLQPGEVPGGPVIGRTRAVSNPASNRAILGRAVRTNSVISSSYIWHGLRCHNCGMSSFFATVKVHPALGRGLAAEEDYDGGPQSAVIFDSLWQREFGTDPHILGQSVTLDGRTYVIVGVMPAGFRLPLLHGAEALLPFAYTKKSLEKRASHWAVAIGRLKPGISEAQANTDLDRKGRVIAARLPDHKGMTM